jgi:DNA invertase Pin-like site-specific DNA recombinase
MKAVIYSRVSTKEQSTARQVEELRNVAGFQPMKVFKEKISGFSKSAKQRPELNKAFEYMNQHEIDCIMVHEISRLGRNTVDVLNLIEVFKDHQKIIYIHNLGIKINTQNAKDEMFSKLIVTLMIDLARLESEQMSYRIKSGIKARKKRGLNTGRKVGSTESHENFLNKHKDIQKYFKKGYSFREIQKICKCSPNTIQKVKMILSEQNNRN